ncbi:hypothetical protein BJ742DRAFT_13808 [Cladochytrium replicatum]|nr:hypothetical protein BJ742DRAFT_13808 [Cladochytrium replicatum]
MTNIDNRFGSGIWLAEMNRDFPRGYYYGVDISISAFGETFRDLAEDGKITLVTGNVYERLPFEDSTFDYIHQQGLSQAIPERLWPSAISELVRVLKPGGVIDLIEIVPVAVPTGKPDPIVRDLHHAQYKALMSRGLNIYIGHSLLNLVEMYPMLEHATCIRRTAPVGWDGLAGELWSTNAKKAFIAAADFASVAAGKTKEEWAAYIDRVAIGWAQSKSFANVFRVTAHKRNS